MAQSRKPKLSRRAKAVWADRGDQRFNSELPGDVSEEIQVEEEYPLRQRLLLDLTNMRNDGLEWFQWRWQFKIRPERDKDISRLRNELRAVWKDPRGDDAYNILMKWLAWRPSREHLRVYKNTPWIIQWVNPKHYVPFYCDVEAARLVPDWGTVRAMLIQGVFEHWRNFKICANADCAAPYFVAKRKDQTVCDAEICKAEKQRQHALKWWNENRAKKSQNETVSKTAKKGSKDNVTRKAR